MFRSGSDAVEKNGKNSRFAKDILVYGLNFDAAVVEEENVTAYSYEKSLADLEQFLKETAANYHGELILIPAHTGLHVLGKQPESVDSEGKPIDAWIGDNMYKVDKSYELAALINRCAEQYGMDIMYLFGHDHSRQETAMLLKEGDTLISTKQYADHSFDSQTLHFTYANEGYLSEHSGGADSKFSLIYRDGGKYVYDLICTTDKQERSTVIPSKYQPDYASAERFAEMAQADYQQKTGVTAEAKAVRNAKTGVGKNASGAEVNLPQTGYTLCVTAAAFVMTVCGAYLICKSLRRRKED